MGAFLNHKLECPDCGTIYLDIPSGAKEFTPIACSTCGRPLGSWGELQDDFNRQSGSGAFDLKNGRIERKD